MLKDNLDDKLEFIVENTINRIQVKREDDSIFLRVDRSQSFLGRFTLSYFNSDDKIFLILEKYDYLLYFTRKIRMNNLKRTAYFRKEKLTYIMSFDDKLIEFKTLDVFGRQKEIFLNHIKIGQSKPICISQDIDKYVLSFISDKEDDILLCLISYCSNLTFSFN